MEEPLVSVVIPAYRCAGTIGRAVESALRQDAELEILVIDDASGEDLAQALRRFEKDPRVRLIKNKENIGAAKSRNRGVQMARGVYTAFLDADDYWADGKLRKQLAALEKTGCVLCCTARELMRPDGTLTGRVIPAPEKITYRRLLRHNCINCSSVLARTDVLRRFPMEHEEAHEDYLTWLRILKEYGCACAVNEPLLKYSLSASGKSGSKLKSARMTFLTYRCAGFGWGRSALCFFSYALHGVLKYAGAWLK